jgi:tetratricopeptide (TPR) repeat protein
VLFHEGELDIAEQQAQNALVIFKQLDNLPNIGTTFYQLGRIEVSRCRFDLAQTYYEQGVGPAEKAGLHKVVASIILGKGDALFGRCKYEDARHEFRRAGEYLKARGLPKNYVNIYVDISIAEAAIPLGELEEGRKHSIAALHFAQKLGWAHGIYLSKMFVGDVAFASEPQQLSEARKMYMECLNGFAKAGFVVEQGQCCVRLGVLEASQGRVDDGLRFYVMALARFRKMSSVQYLAKLFICMGDLFLTQGDADTASVLYRAALPVSQRYDSVQDIADALLGRGLTDSSPKVRKRLIMEARSLLEQIGNTRGVEKCRAMLTEVDM